MRIRAKWLLVVCTAFLPLADNAATSKVEATVIEGRVVDALGKAPKAGVDVVAVALKSLPPGIRKAPVFAEKEFRNPSRTNAERTLRQLLP